MAYESGSNGLGVGQTYGSNYGGNIVANTVTTSGEGRLVFEFDGTSPVDHLSYTFPEGYAAISRVYVDVDYAFASGTVDVMFGVLPIGPSPAALTAVGVIEYGLSTYPVPVVPDQAITILLTSVSYLPGGALAKVIVEYTRA